MNDFGFSRLRRDHARVWAGDSHCLHICLALSISLLCFGTGFPVVLVAQGNHFLCWPVTVEHIGAEQKVHQIDFGYHIAFAHLEMLEMPFCTPVCNGIMVKSRKLAYFPYGQDIRVGFQLFLQKSLITQQLLLRSQVQPVTQRCHLSRIGAFVPWIGVIASVWAVFLRPGSPLLQIANHILCLNGVTPCFLAGVDAGNQSGLNKKPGGFLADMADAAHLFKADRRGKGVPDLSKIVFTIHAVHHPLI